MGDPSPISGQAMLVAFITIAVMAVLAWFLRKTAATRRAKGVISVETAVPLGERRSLVVVAVEGRRLLLGLTPTQISLVTELNKPFESALDESTRSDG